MLLLALDFLLAGYKIKEVQVRPAAEYDAGQSFQNIVIGARAFTTEEEILTLFDTRKLYSNGFVPVLLVIENNNDFAVRLSGKEIYLSHDGVNLQTVPYQEVLMEFAGKKKKNKYSTHEDILLKNVKNRDMVADFEHKSFGEKLIPPHGSDFGVVFFQVERLDPGARIYIPNMTNLETREPLMFFEFDLN